MSSVNRLIDYMPSDQAVDARSPGHAEQLAAQLIQRLHDGPTQWIALALLDLEIALGTSGQIDAFLLGSVRALLREALSSVRGLLDAWCDGVAETQMPLAASMASLGHRIAALTGLEISLDCDKRVADPPGPVAMTVLHAAQELLVNTCKHAPGAKVEMMLVAAPRGFELTINDDGPGFDPTGLYDRQSDFSGLGLAAMPDRLARVGASFCLNSRPGAGVKACIRWSADGIPPEGPDAGASPVQCGPSQ